jgi:hypothetical protein
VAQQRGTAVAKRRHTFEIEGRFLGFRQRRFLVVFDEFARGIDVFSFAVHACKLIAPARQMAQQWIGTATATAASA